MNEWDDFVLNDKYYLPYWLKLTNELQKGLVDFSNWLFIWFSLYILVQNFLHIYKLLNKKLLQYEEYLYITSSFRLHNNFQPYYTCLIAPPSRHICVCQNIFKVFEFELWMKNCGWGKTLLKIVWQLPKYLLWVKSVDTLQQNMIIIIFTKNNKMIIRKYGHVKELISISYTYTHIPHDIKAIPLLWILRWVLIRERSFHHVVRYFWIWALLMGPKYFVNCG